MKKYLLIALFCFSAAIAFSQTHKADSLKHLVRLAKDNRNKLSVLLKLCRESDVLPVDTLWKYALAAKYLAKESGDKQGYSNAVLAQADAYFKWGKIDSAKAIIEPELLKYNVDDPGSREIYFNLEEQKINCIGESYNYKSGFDEVYKVLKAAEKYKDSVVMAKSLNTLGSWNYNMDFLPRSRNFFYKAIAYIPPRPEYFGLAAGIYLNLGDNYRWIGNLDSAEYCVNKAIALSARVDNFSLMSYALQSSATLEAKKQQYAKAEQAMLKSIEVYEKIDGKVPQPGKVIVLASIYEKWGQVKKAIKVLNDGLVSDSIYKSKQAHGKKSNDDKDLQKIFYYQELAKCYKQIGDSKSYEATLEKIIAGKDAFYKANSAQAIAELETKYETQKKETTIAQQRLALIKDKYFNYGILILVSLGAVIIFLVIKDIYKKQKLKLEKIQEEDRRLALKAVADAEESERKRIATDLHDNLGAQLSFIKRNVNFIIDRPEGFSPKDEKKYLGYVNDIAQNALVDLRETIWVLNKNSVDIQDFADKLKSYLKQQLLDKDMITWDFQENIDQSWQFSSGEVMHIFRIVQELVSNIIKHSGASHICIKLYSNEPNTYYLELTDNGKGFDAKGKYDGHYGLENIQQRAREIDALLYIESNADNGTRVQLIKGINSTSALLTDPPTPVNFTQ